MNPLNQPSEIKSVKKTRTFLLNLVKDLSTEQLNKIPPGFNNNIIWNLGHLIAAQQGICYLKAGLPPAVPETYIQLYKSGTKPAQFVDSNEAITIKQTLLTSIEQLETDLQKKLFVNYNTWSTRYSIELSGIDDALQFLLFHEGLHSGYITILKRQVTS